jgi:ABC-type uncharacterized transport system involved in gliding motility auxiliary subunit
MLVAIGGAVWYLDRQMTRQISFLLIAGVVLMIAYAVLDPSSVADLLLTRRGRSGSFSVLATAVLLGALVVLNILASRGAQTIDLTQAHLNTLAPQSVLVVKRLDADLRVIGFYGPSDDQSRKDAEDLLSLYAAQSPHVKVRFEDPQLALQDLQRYGVHESGTLVLDFKGKTELLLPGTQSEQDVTSALLKLESSRTPGLCWVSGHGERDLKEGNQIDGYTAAADLLTRNNFKTMDVLLANGVPAQCDLLALVGPRRPLADAEKKAMSDYLGAGGSLIATADPWVDAATLASLNDVLKPFGLSFDGALVLDPDPAHFANSPEVPVATSYGATPIARGIDNLPSAFVSATAVVAAGGGDATRVPIVTTSAQAYEIASRRDNLNRAAADKAGPFVLMESAERTAAGSGGKKSRAVLVGSSSFAQNEVMPPEYAGVNSQLLLGSMEWLTEQESLIALPPKPSRTLPLALTQEQQALVTLLTLLLLPMAVAAAGLAVWARRRFA